MFTLFLFRIVIYMYEPPLLPNSIICVIYKIVEQNVTLFEDTGKCKKNNIRIERFPEVCCSYDRLSVFLLGKALAVNGHSISL